MLYVLLCIHFPVLFNIFYSFSFSFSTLHGQNNIDINIDIYSAIFQRKWEWMHISGLINVTNGLTDIIILILCLLLLYSSLCCVDCVREEISGWDMTCWHHWTVEEWSSALFQCCILLICCPCLSLLTCKSIFITKWPVNNRSRPHSVEKYANFFSININNIQPSTLTYHKLLCLRPSSTRPFNLIKLNEDWHEMLKILLFNITKNVCSFDLHIWS